MSAGVGLRRSRRGYRERYGRRRRYGTSRGARRPAGAGALNAVARLGLVVRGIVYVIIGAIVLSALFAPLLAPLGPDTMHLRARFHAPSAEYLFGTDSFGRDIFSRVLYGARLSMWIGLATAVISGAIGTAIGVIAAQYRRLDAPLMRVMDGLMAIPAEADVTGPAAAVTRSRCPSRACGLWLVCAVHEE